MHPLHRLLLLLLPAVTGALAPPRFPSPHARSRPRVGAGVGGYEYETRYFRQRLDHFSFLEEEEAFFEQRYLVGRPRRAHLLLRQRGRHRLVRRQLRPRLGRCPALLRPRRLRRGNNLITAFSCVYLFCVDHARCVVVYCLAAASLLRGVPNNSKSLAYLTAEQALAENAVLLTELKRNLSAEGSPVVLFGGSYGGMLAAWMRLKYPHIAIGALASSAPILQFEDIVPSTIFYDLVSDDFKRESVSCFQTIKDSWKALDEQGNGQDGLLKLSKTFHLCQTLKTTGDLSDWLSSAYSYLAMVDYPMPSDFLMPLPASPIKEVCRNIDNQPEGTSTLERIYAGVNIYYNYTGTVDCFDLDDDPHGMGGWDWQACTEMVMPMSYSEGISMFPPYEFDYASYAEGCVKSFGVRPRPRWVTTEFGGHNISAALEKFGSNIVFFNGLLDPWSGGGVLKNISGSVIAIVAPLGAHHIDLRPATKEDPDWLVGLRESELEIISGWLSDYYGARGPLFQRAAAKGSAAS